MTTASQTNKLRKPPTGKWTNTSPLQKAIRKNYQLYLLLLPPILYFVIFKYIPMAGNVVAFRRYFPGLSLFGTQWVGLRYFKMFILDPGFWGVFKNTVVLSVLTLVITFPLPILFAILLNEIHHSVFKKVVQTSSYLPQFFSTVVVVGMLNILLNPESGLINVLLGHFGISSINFMNESSWFRPIYILSEIWQHLGWNAILFIAALTNVDPQLYEAAEIDGAGRFKQTLYVTLPGIMPTIIIVLILSVGNVLNLGFEKILLMYNPKTYDVADVIQTMVYRVGIVGNSYSYATAIGLFQSLISLFLLFTVNRFAKKVSDISLW